MSAETDVRAKQCETRLNNLKQEPIILELFERLDAITGPQAQPSPDSLPPGLHELLERMAAKIKNQGDALKELVAFITEHKETVDAVKKEFKDEVRKLKNARAKRSGKKKKKPGPLAA